YHKKQWYRLITHAFVHADYMHLFINMLVFLSFGIVVEKMFGELKLIGIISNPTFHFVTLYLGGTIIASLTTLKKHKDNYYYNSVGASGAVSAIVFTSIFFQPLSNLYLMGIIPIPAIVFGVVYLVYSNYMSRKSTDNINHDAHFIGAVFGFIYPLLIDPKLFKIFLNQLGLWVN
ncbi:MAG: rhomboid family intramembrane serine protease, partial [Bacteroidales bacterium]|nr:rhomboid family intramembrane serine protease [Bacteroidales bacterium]